MGWDVQIYNEQWWPIHNGEIATCDGSSKPRDKAGLWQLRFQF